MPSTVIGKMLVTTPEIVWHSKDPVFSVDFHQRDGGSWRLASAGADHTIRIWRVARRGNEANVTFIANLERHIKAVNVVRFSPNGQYLASGSDDATICLWQLNTDRGDDCVAMETDSSENNKENWTMTRSLRGHVEDIYDMCWSCDSLRLISGSVDNTAIVWNINTGDKLCILRDSKHYIQGVAWDRSGYYLATLGTDRALRIYKMSNSQKDKFKCIHSISKLNEMDNMKSTRLFLDETISSFFRRLSFSPDGNILIVPGGQLCPDNGSILNVSWVFTKASLPKPVLYLPTAGKPSIIVKFCPILFELRPSVPSMMQLPYRMVYVVLTSDKVILYDTQQMEPIGYVGDIHYASLTDCTWNSDGTMLVLSSTDGYCTIVMFDEMELGTPLPADHQMISSPVSSPSSSEISEAPPTTATDHAPSINTTPTFTRRITPIKINDNGATPPKTTPTTYNTTPKGPSNKPPRRVNFTTLT